MKYHELFSLTHIMNSVKLIFTPGGIFHAELRFCDDVTTVSLRIAYNEMRKPKIEQQLPGLNLAEPACVGLRLETPCWKEQSKIAQFWLISSFFDLIDAKHEAEFFATEELKWSLLFSHGNIPLKCIFKIVYGRAWKE